MISRYVLRHRSAIAISRPIQHQQQQRLRRRRSVTNLVALTRHVDVERTAYKYNFQHRRREKKFWTNQSNYRYQSSSAALSKEESVGTEISTPNAASSSSSTSSGKGEKSIEEQYSKKSPLEHVLLRPGMYVGPVERLPPTRCWVLEPTPEPYNPETVVSSSASASSSSSESLDTNATETSTTTTSNESYRMVSKELGLIPALGKIFDEILVNASDNRLRNPKTCNKLDVRIDPGSYNNNNIDNENGERNRDPSIRIWNNGKGIPVQIHKEENMYVPEMLFGHLLTGSNFDDNEKRLTGGRHGYGAKLTNIFSKSFTVETVDTRRKKRYRQTWYDNMTKVTDPEISTISSNNTTGTEDYTCIEFVPDMVRLTGDVNAKVIDEQDYAVMCRRVFDAAGCGAGKLQVLLNGKDVSVPTFADYTMMYRREGHPPMLFTEINHRWKVGVGLSTSNSLESVSFVNGMNTSRGGTHVNALVGQIIKKIQDAANKIDPNLGEVLNTSLIRRNLFISCDSLIENPSFDSQMKECLTSNPKNFGSSYTLTEKFLSALVQPEPSGGPGIVEEVIRVAKGRQQANLLKEVGGQKSKRQLLSIPKLEDAHAAGTSNGCDCSLILTEGDSAKALAVAGLEVIGREKFGVFPLRGKFLNVRHASVEQLTKNEEVKALVAILGLNFDKEYETEEERKELRYGHIVLMTDQDTDGSHIKGLVINFFRHFWPKLLKPSIDGPSDQTFLSAFATPLLKATKKGKKETKSFYSMPDYNTWRNSLGSEAEIKKWKVKYYKGLGTSTPAEAKQYFADFENHRRPFQWTSELDGEFLDKVFDKSRAADRREWISTEYDPSVTLNFDFDSEEEEDDGEKSKNSVAYKDFINKEMIHFSHADNIRSLPSLIDGLKPSQRKVLFACFKRRLKSEIKVAQLSGYCAEHTAYHHGEASLQSTIIGMAQDFVGSNNVNLLVPSGQFGTRLTGGEDAASPRYIFTYLSPLTRYLFPEDDDILLEYLEDDGQFIEPKHYCPIIPLLLVNGSQGIGTGWSTNIPPHDPMSVLDYIRGKLDQQSSCPPIEPHARGFVGSIDRTEDGSAYVTTGKIKQVDNKTVFISELPVGVWTSSYKGHLLRMQSKGEIVDFMEDHTTTSVAFTVRLKPSQLGRMKKTGLHKAFRLTSKLQLTNMNAFDENGKIHKFHSPEAIADAYFPHRLGLYHDRKSVLKSRLEHKTAMLQNKARFIMMVSNGEIEIVGGNTTRDATTELLKQAGFMDADELKKMKMGVLGDQNTAQDLDDVETNLAGSENEDNDNHDDDDDNTTSGANYDYLLNMPISSLTAERIQHLNDEATETQSHLNDITKTRPEELWLSDLEKLSSAL